MAKKCVRKIFCAGAENEEWNSLVTCSADLVPNTTINLYALITIFPNINQQTLQKNRTSYLQQTIEPERFMYFDCNS